MVPGAEEADPIYLVDLKDPIETGITFSETFLRIQAWLRCNGTPEDVVRVWEGRDDPKITHALVSFYLAEQAVQTHTRDAIDIETEKRRVAAKNKK